MCDRHGTHWGWLMDAHGSYEAAATHAARVYVPCSKLSLKRRPCIDHYCGAARQQPRSPWSVWAPILGYCASQARDALRRAVCCRGSLVLLMPCSHTLLFCGNFLPLLTCMASCFFRTGDANCFYLSSLTCSGRSRFLEECLFFNIYGNAHPSGRWRFLLLIFLKLLRAMPFLCNCLIFRFHGFSLHRPVCNAWSLSFSLSFCVGGVVLLHLTFLFLELAMLFSFIYLFLTCSERCC